jgi:hypothetical protein
MNNTFLPFAPVLLSGIQTFTRTGEATNPSVALILNSVDLCEKNCYTEFHRGEKEFH